MNKKIILIISLLSIFLIVNTPNTVMADIGDIFYTFEMDNVGDTNVSNAYIDVHNNKGGEVDDAPVYAGIRSYKLDGGAGNSIRITFTGSYKKVFLYWRCSSFGAGEFKLYFYNDNDENILYMKNNQPNGNDLYVKDHEGNYDDLSGNLAIDTWYKLTVSMNDTDTVYIENGNTDLEDTPTNLLTNFNISYIIISYTDIGDTFHIDNIGYNTVYQGEAGTECKQINGVVLRSNDKALDTFDVLQGTKVKYDMTVYGDIGAEVYVIVSDSDGDLVYLKQYIMETTTDEFTFTILYSYAWAVGTYTMGINDWLFVPCDGDFTAYWTENFTVFNPVLDDYYNIYYNASIGLFAEFDTIQHPELEVGDNIPVVYHLPKNNSCTNEIDCGFWYVIALYRNGRYVTNVPIVGKNMTNILGNDFGEFYKSGVYQLKVFNVSCGYDKNVSNFNDTDKIPVYVSHTIEIGNVDLTTPVGDFNFDIDEPQVRFIIAIGITLCFAFMGAGLGTRMTGDNAELVMALTFMAFGICISAYFQLIPLWIPYTLSLFPVAYIIGIIYGQVKR